MTTEKPDLEALRERIKHPNDACSCGHVEGVHYITKGWPACTECQECQGFEKRQEPTKEESK